MTNEEIEKRLRIQIGRNRKITSEQIELIREAEKRKLFLRRGYSTIYEWLVKEFKLSHGAAYRRMQAAQLTRAHPRAMEKLSAGKLNLTTVAQLQTAIRRQERESGKQFDLERAEKILEELEEKSEDASRILLARHFPHTKALRSFLRAITENESRLSVVISSRTKGLLLRGRDVASHACPQGGWCEVLAHVFDDYLARRDPLRKVAKPRTSGPDTQCVAGPDTQRVAGPENNAGALSSSERAKIIQRAGGRCEFRDPETQRRCESTYQLEVEHIHPRALGGDNRPENLRALCRPHNQYEAERLLGPNFLSKSPAEGI